MAVKHTTAADGTFSGSGATAWGADHTVDAGTITEAMLSVTDLTTKDVSTSAHGFVPKAPSDVTKFLRGDATWAAPSVTLNGIAAATAASTIANGNNTGQIWNWANTADSTVAFTFGETSAATGGTSTSGVPNQVLLKLTTAAASTQSPLSVYSRAAHVFSVSPTTAQIFATNGSKTAPVYSFASRPSDGFYSAGTTNIRLAIGGANYVIFGAGFNYFTDTDGAIANGPVSISGLNVNNNTSGAAQFQSILASADSTANIWVAAKSRGTITSPTVITTGDDLLTIRGYGYIGATNTYQEATRVTHDSTGTISDATNGIGGILRFSTRKQGTDTTVVERFRVDDAGHLVSIAGTANTPTITAGGGTNPTITGTDNAFTVTIGTGGIASSVEVTFGTAFANAPVSSAQSDTDILALKSTPLTTKVTIAASVAFSAGSNIDCVCIGRA